MIQSQARFWALDKTFVGLPTSEPSANATAAFIRQLSPRTSKVAKLCQASGSKRATVAAWDALAPEIRRANSRPSKTTWVLSYWWRKCVCVDIAVAGHFDIFEIKAWIASPLAGKFALIDRQRANLGQRFYWKEVVDLTCAVLSTQPADVSSSRWACILQSGHRRWLTSIFYQ